jgi:hypothetical protein
MSFFVNVDRYKRMLANVRHVLERKVRKYDGNLPVRLQRRLSTTRAQVTLRRWGLKVINHLSNPKLHSQEEAGKIQLRYFDLDLIWNNIV